MRTKGGKSHLRRKKTRAVRRLYDNKLPLHKADEKRIERLLPGI
jgi:ribosomal protein L35